MKPISLLFIFLLQYLLSQSETYSYASIIVRFNCSYSQDKSSLIRSNTIVTRLISNIGISNFYDFITDVKNDQKLIIEKIHCFYSPYVNGICNQSFESSYLYFRNENFMDDKFLQILQDNSNPKYDFQEFLRQFFFKSLDPQQSNFVCTLLNRDASIFHKPPGYHNDPVTKTSLFGIIFLSTCIILVFVLCFGWFVVIYYRRFRQYRMKKKLRQALAESTQQILDKSPVITFDSNNRDPDQTDNEPLCAICLETFKSQEKIRKLVCKHFFHLTCIDPWLLSRQSCPLCNRNILRNSIPSISSNILAAINERNNDLSTTIATHGNNQTNRV